MISYIINSPLCHPRCRSLPFFIQIQSVIVSFTLSLPNFIKQLSTVHTSKHKEAPKSASIHHKSNTTSKYTGGQQIWLKKSYTQDGTRVSKSSKNFHVYVNYFLNLTYFKNEKALTIFSNQGFLCSYRTYSWSYMWLYLSWH